MRKGAMAQLERPKTLDHSKSSRAQGSPTFEQLLRVDEAFWSPKNPSPAVGTHHVQEEFSSPNNNNKKSVLTKVKERAKKLKHSLSGRKRQGNELAEDQSGSTPSWSVTMEDEYEDENENEDENDQIDHDPEYLGAPMYESEAAPEILKETARQHPRAVPVVSEKHMVPNRAHENITMSDAISSKIIAGEEPESNAASFQGNDEENTGKYSGTPQTWDKGVSVKEYLMNKLEPGEDEKALSQAITEAISPRKTSSNNNGDTGVVEKVKDAVTSFFWHENIKDIPENNITCFPNSPCSKAFYNFPSTSTPNSSPLIPLSSTANSSPLIPLSSTAHQPVPEDENDGKILQAN